MSGMTAPESHRHAGYKGPNPAQTEAMPAIKARMKWLQTQAATRVVEANAVTRVEIIESLRETRRMAKQGTAVVGKDGEPTGTYKSDLASANRSDEVLAKMHGFMLDVTRTETFDDELDGKSQVELEAIVLSLLEQLDPNMRKKLVERIETPAIDMETIGEGETLQ